jgi:DmsE family decaheme c-type cytochrome
MLLLVLLLAAGAGGLAQEQAAPLPEGYAGSETCALCHERVAGIFRRDPHFGLDTGGKGAGRRQEWKGRACEACHGPGKKHSDAGDSLQIFYFGGSIRNPAPAPADQVNQRCLSCHAGEQTHNGKLFGSHNRNLISCTQCHTVHQAFRRPLLAREPNAICQECHLSVRAEFTRPYRHKLQEGAMECVDCHNPHGSPPARELRQVSANETACLKCHGDKRGPFPFEHAPVRLSSCATCHEPHGSANPRLLVRQEQSFLCLECHTTNTTASGGTPPAFHDLRSARFRNCTICHSKIHGSFVSRDLLR